MAANVICITDPAKWAIIAEFLGEVDEGAIVLGPKACAAFAKEYGQDPDECLIDYDFGGEADLWLDYSNSDHLDNIQINAICQHMGLPTPEEKRENAETCVDKPGATIADQD